MIFSNKIRVPFSFIFFLISISSFGREISIDTSTALPESIKKQVPGEIKGHFNFTDTLGQHFLVLAREHKIEANEKEYIAIRALQFISDDTAWKQEWIIKDYIECQGVDISGEFLINLVSFSDLDANNIVETTIPYYLICAGGIEPRLTKVIMRQREVKYAVRGESFVRVDEKTSYGGTFKADKELDLVPKFKTHLISVWKKAAGIN